jgi:hypothetical protein
MVLRTLLVSIKEEVKENEEVLIHAVQSCVVMIEESTHTIHTTSTSVLLADRILRQ